MAFGDFVKSKDVGAYATSVSFDTPVSAGNSILVITGSIDGDGGLPTSVSDDLNGAYSQVITEGTLPSPVAQIYLYSGSAGGSPTITLDAGPKRSFIAEIEGALSAAGVSGAGSGTGTSVTTASGTIPATSVTVSAIQTDPIAVFTPVAPWTKRNNNAGLAFSTRTDTSSTSGSLSGSLNVSAEWSGEWASFVEAGGADTTAPVFNAGPTVTATTSTGHTISSTLDETGTIYGVRLTDGAGAPSSAQVKAGQDSAGSAAPEATSVAATAATNADLVFSTGSASTAYDYYIVAEDDEGTPNLQASPTLVEATTAATPVEGLPVYTLKKDGSALGNLTGIKVRVTATGELDGTEYYSANNLTATAGVMDSTIDLSATAATIGDTVTVEILTTANEGIVFTDLVEDIA